MERSFRVGVLGVGVINMTSGMTKYKWSIYENKGMYAYLGPGYLLLATKDSFKIGDKFDLFGNDSNRSLSRRGEIRDFAPCDDKESVLRMLYKNGYDYYPIKPFKKRQKGMQKLITSYSVKGIIYK